MKPDPARTPEWTRRTSADQRRFELKPAQWDAFTDALGRPVKEIPELKKLMREPSILERRVSPPPADH